MSNININVKPNEMYPHGTNYRDRTDNAEVKKELGVSWNDLKDKPFGYGGLVEGTILEEITVEFGRLGDPVMLLIENGLESNQTYTVVFDNTTYECVPFMFDEHSGIFGNISLAGDPEDTNEPFCCMVDYFGDFVELSIYARQYPESHTISISGPVPEIKYIDDAFISKNITRSVDTVGKKDTTGNSGEIFNDYNNNVASGNHAHAEGLATNATGHRSHAEGSSNTASGNESHAEGKFTQASGEYSHAEGFFTFASSTYQHVQGRKNIEDATNTYAHIVGNGVVQGSNQYASNAHTIDWSGNATFAGTVNGSGADYAEYFEWSDGNVNKEDRVGLIVTLDGEKIRLANAGDDILGIVSGTALVLGDNAEWEWKNKYLVDDYGRVITEIVEEFAEHKNYETDEVEQVSLGLFPHRKLNPDYDPEQAYIRRCDRSEWETIGMLGKLHVTDDGSCSVGGYATVGTNGVATNSAEKTNMRVMKRITDNIILVLMK